MHEIEYDYLTIKPDDWAGSAETITSKAELREELENLYQDFLRSGGRVQELPIGATGVEGARFMFGCDATTEQLRQSAQRGAKAAKHFTANARRRS